MGAEDQLVGHRQAHGRGCGAADAAAPPAALPVWQALHALAEDEQARVGLLHHSPDAFCCEAPVGGQSAVAKCGAAVRLIVEILWRVWHMHGAAL
jgi:hypothetical protein